jgi:hypothetical protein
MEEMSWEGGSASSGCTLDLRFEYVLAVRNWNFNKRQRISGIRVDLDRRAWLMLG